MPPSSVALQGGESAAELADGRAGGAEDHGLGHGTDDSLRRWRSGPPRTTRPTPAPTPSSSACSTARASRTTSPDGSLQALVDVRRGALGVPLAHPHARRRAALDPDRARRARRLRRRARADRGGDGARPRARAAARASLCWELPHKVAGRGRRARSSRARCWPPTATRSSSPSRARTARPRRWSSPPTTTSPRRSRPAAPAPRPPTARATSATRRPTCSRPRRWRSGRARSTGVQVEVMGRAEIEAAGMGAFAAVAQGAGNEPQLITLRHEPAGASGPLLGLVGKAVTFDTGGYSIKPAARMHEMKFDMCGGAAVLEATGAIAQLGLPVRLVERDRRDREHGLRARGAPGRHRALEGRDHDRGRQHRRRGAAGARRLPHARARPGRRAAGRRRDADRRRS